MVTLAPTEFAAFCALMPPGIVTAWSGDMHPARDERGEHITLSGNAAQLFKTWWRLTRPPYPTAVHNDRLK